MAMQDLPRRTLLSTFPGRYYIDPEIYALEQERIFSCIWLCVGYSGAIPDPGMYQCITVAQESIILLRDQQGRIRAFYNVCRHRGTRLCTAASGHLKGSLQCPYHSWTYKLDGRLIGAPNVLGVDEFDASAFGLIPIAVEVWGDLIWINLADNPPSLASNLAHPLISFGFDPFLPLLEHLKVGKVEIYEIRANWKIMVENTLECYHCPSVHPELCDRFAALHSYPTVDEKNIPVLAEGVEAYTMTGRASRPPLPGLSSEEARHIYIFFLSPNILLTLLYDHVQVQVFHPRSHDTTSITAFWLFAPESVTAPDFDPMDTVELANLVMKQDIKVCELPQQGVASRVFADGGVYVSSEEHICLFRDFVLGKLAPENVPAEPQQ